MEMTETTKILAKLHDLYKDVLFGQFSTKNENTNFKVTTITHNTTLKTIYLFVVLCLQNKPRDKNGLYIVYVILMGFVIPVFFCE